MNNKSDIVQNFSLKVAEEVSAPTQIFQIFRIVQNEWSYEAHIRAAG